MFKTILGILLVILTVFAVVSSHSANAQTQPPATVTVTATQTVTVTLPPVTVTQTVTIPAPVPTQTPAANSQSPNSTKSTEPVKFSGTGDDVSAKFTLVYGLAIFTVKHDGSSNFIVHLVSDTGDDTELLVNAIGPYNGKAAIGIAEDNFMGAKPGTYLLDISADGPWSVMIEQPAPNSATTLPASYSGTGSGVSEFFTLNSGTCTFSMTHDGTRNFVVKLLAARGKTEELLANEIGVYSGKKVVAVNPDNIFGTTPGTYILVITADGKWSVNISQ